MMTKTYSTDPDWYTTEDSLDGVPTDVLQAVWHNAQRTYSTCGGHQRASRMYLVMNLVAARLQERGVR